MGLTKRSSFAKGKTVADVEINKDNFLNKFKLINGFKKFVNNSEKNQAQLKVFTTSSINDNNQFLINLAIKNPIDFIKYFVNEATIEYAIKTNPNIERILSENHLPKTYELENVLSIAKSHLIPVANLAKKIYLKKDKSKNSNHEMNVYIAALLHDIGKIFIPSNILNKTSKLTIAEREIIKLHSQLSYEILKTTCVNNQIAKLALEHHRYEADFQINQFNQSITTADIYCALRERRSYKKPIGDIAAKTIMYDMAVKGQLDITYISLI